MTDQIAIHDPASLRGSIGRLAGVKVDLTSHADRVQGLGAAAGAAPLSAGQSPSPVTEVFATAMTALSKSTAAAAAEVERIAGRLTETVDTMTSIQADGAGVIAAAGDR